MRVFLVAAVVLPLAVPAVSPEERAQVKALPGNKACPYPADAHKLRVAGPVRFMAQVKPDGTVESVEVEKVPLPRLAFEETVRACVAEWRFEAAPKGEDGLRRYRGRVRFRSHLKKRRRFGSRSSGLRMR